MLWGDPMKEVGFPHSLASKESACNAGDLGSIPRLGRSPGEENGNPLHYSWLENPMDREALQATLYGVARVGHDLVTKPPWRSRAWGHRDWGLRINGCCQVPYEEEHSRQKQEHVQGSCGERECRLGEPQTGWCELGSNAGGMRPERCWSVRGLTR